MILRRLVLVLVAVAGCVTHATSSRASALDAEIVAGAAWTRLSDPLGGARRVGDGLGPSFGARIAVERTRLVLRLSATRQELPDAEYTVAGSGGGPDPDAQLPGGHCWNVDATAGSIVLRRGRMSLAPHGGLGVRLDRSTDAEEFERAPRNRVVGVAGASIRVAVGTRMHVRPDVSLRFDHGGLVGWEASFGLGWRFHVGRPVRRQPSGSSSGAP